MNLSSIPNNNNNNNNNNHNHNPNNSDPNKPNSYKQIIDKEQGIIYYEDERGDTYNPIEFKFIEDTVDKKTSYYLSRLTAIWENKKDHQFLHREEEEREKWAKEVEEKLNYIRTDFADWYRN